MLKFSQLSLRRGAQVLLQDINQIFHAGQHIGISGANGCGKSSLFALIRGELHADSGEFEMPERLVIAHVAQETPGVDSAAIDYVIEGDAELHQTLQALKQAEAAGDGEKQAELHAQLEGIGGYDAQARAARLMHGLGFSADQEQLAVNSFSGGWRMRLNLAQALMCRSDLLLLDEPTNHLDLDAVFWLEGWLRRYEGTLMLISHDRDFLDRVVSHIAHIEHQSLNLYSGNYTDFEQQRAARLAGQQAAYEKQQREIQHIQSYVDRFRAKASKAKQAQSRLKALERLETIAPAHVDSPFAFEFFKPAKTPSPLLNLDQTRLGYGDTTILDRIELSLLPGQRIGLLGHNGAGKSTLIKCLAGELPPLVGALHKAADLHVGYFAQHQLEQLHADDTPLLHLQRLAPKASEQELRNFLGGFGFVGDQALAPVGPFSGGEKARLVLALTVYQKPNLLLLDEPTNHLDMEMRHALSLALQEFDGCMVLVSHDRHLLRTVCDEFLLVGDGRVSEYQGDLEDYRHSLMESIAQEDAKSTVPAQNSAAARKDRKRQQAEQRKQLQPLKKALASAEKRMDELEQKKQALDEQLADQSLYSDDAKEQLKSLLLEKSEVDRAHQQAEDLWLEKLEALEALQDQLASAIV